VVEVSCCYLDAVNVLKPSTDVLKV